MKKKTQYYQFIKTYLCNFAYVSFMNEYIFLKLLSTDS